MKKKFEFIDYSKGVGIILVILGHIGFGVKFIYTFHMPLFFLLSGFLMTNINEKNFKNFVTGKLRSVIVPYYIFSLLSYVWWGVFERRFRSQEVSPTEALKDIFLPTMDSMFIYNVVLWFLVTLFFSYIFVFLLIKYFYRNVYIGLAVSFSLFLTFAHLNAPKIFEMGIVLSGAQLFMTLGHFLRPFIIKKMDEAMKASVIFNITNCIFLVIFTYSLSNINNGVNMMSNSYGVYHLFILGGLSGSFLVFYFSVICIKLRFRFLKFFGVNSLALMCLHEPIKRITVVLVSKIMRVSNDFVRINFFPSIIVLLIVLLISSLYIFLINKIELKLSKINSLQT